MITLIPKYYKMEQVKQLRLIESASLESGVLNRLSWPSPIEKVTFHHRLEGVDEMMHVNF